MPHRLALWLPVVCRAGLRSPAGGSRGSCHAALCALPAAPQQGPLLQSDWRLSALKLSLLVLVVLQSAKVRSMLEAEKLAAKFGTNGAIETCYEQAFPEVAT